MKALILSVSAGGGHHQAALAIDKYINKYEPESTVKVLDTIKYINPILDKFIIGGYLKAVKNTPSIYGKLYKLTENMKSEDGLKSFSNKFNEMMAFKILPSIKEFNPDIIICTNFFPLEMISILKEKKELNTPLVCVITDYGSHGVWLNSNVDSYIVSNSDMIDELEQNGVSRNIIFDYGIPVNEDFLKLHQRSATLSELQFSENKKTVLIMGGSLGLGRISKIYSELSTSKAKIQIIVIAGSNKKLYNHLLNLREMSAVETRVFGYTSDVNKYMQCSDLLITKPGGLTISEALICKTPLALFSPIPGQEKKNENFLLKHNIAISLDADLNCKKVIEDLLNNTTLLESMKTNCEKYAKPNCGQDIYKLLSNLIKNAH